MNVDKNYRCVALAGITMQEVKTKKIYILEHRKSLNYAILLKIIKMYSEN